MTRQHFKNRKVYRVKYCDEKAIPTKITSNSILLLLGVNSELYSVTYERT
jgi:hypothetical protein